MLKESNPYLRCANTNAYGFALMTVDGAKAEATFVEEGVPTDPTYVGVTARHRFVTRVGTNTVVPR